MQIVFFDKFPSEARLLNAVAILYGLQELLHSQYTSLSPSAILKYDRGGKMKDFPRERNGDGKPRKTRMECNFVRMNAGMVRKGVVREAISRN